MQLHLIRGSSVASCFVAMLRLGEQNCSLRMLSYKTHKGCFKVSDQKERKEKSEIGASGVCRADYAGRCVPVQDACTAGSQSDAVVTSGTSIAKRGPFGRRAACEVRSGSRK